jgi:hypothetical protein
MSKKDHIEDFFIKNDSKYIEDNLKKINIDKKRAEELDELSSNYIKLYTNDNYGLFDIYNILLKLKNEKEVKITDNEFYFILINEGAKIGAEIIEAQIKQHTLEAIRSIKNV